MREFYGPEDAPEDLKIDQLGPHEGVLPKIEFCVKAAAKNHDSAEDLICQMFKKVTEATPPGGRDDGGRDHEFGPVHIDNAPGTPPTIKTDTGKATDWAEPEHTVPTPPPLWM